MSSNFNCSYMARDSLTYILGFSVKLFFQPIYTDNANQAYFDKRSHLKASLRPLNQIKPNLAGMVPAWVPFKIVSDSPALHSRWLLLLKIEISSIVHCCFSISQNEFKFELQLHGQEQFSICSGGFLKFFFQPIYTDYANQEYFDKRSHLNLLL